MRSEKKLASNLNNPYIGRFAPTPSGGLHFGSLVAALASFLQAKSYGGIWRVRIDDLDKFRIVTNASTQILQTLESYQLFWDGAVSYQKNNDEIYQTALNSLSDHSFFCSCTRKSLKSFTIYPGFCCNKNHSGSHCSVRCKTLDINITLKDLCQTDEKFHLKKDIGNFILKRSDGVFSYQLATVIDDHNLGVTEIIRGVDLFQESVKQIYLSQLLGFKSPTYGHIPTVFNNKGQKLSKQTFAKTLSLKNDDIKDNLLKALEFLNHRPKIKLDSIADILNWATKNWQIKRIKV